LENSGLVKKIAARFKGRGIEYEDLIQIGTLGLIKAIRSFETERGFAFSTYAVPLIMGEIKRTLRDEGLIKVGRAQKKLGMDLLGAKTLIMNTEGRDPGIFELAGMCNVSVEEAAIALDSISPVASLSDPIDGEGTLTLESKIPDSENEIERIGDRVALSQAISKLPDTQKKILILRFFKGKTQQKTAVELGLSQVKISREERKILDFLRNELI
jgi:RNA polymerase sporulation-specific sigma factor